MTKFSEVDEPDEELNDLEGEHPAIISKAVLPRDPQKPEQFLKRQPQEPGGKAKGLCDVSFQLQDAEHTATRRYTMSYGQSNTGAWGEWAQLLATACGVPCGAKHQKDLGTEDLEGQAVRVVLKLVEKNGQTYLNVVNVLAPKRFKTQAQEAEGFPHNKPAVKNAAIVEERMAGEQPLWDEETP
jgi:hypothetical protein